MKSPQFCLKRHRADDEPDRDCPVAARQGPPELEMGPVRWPSSRCDEVCEVRSFRARKYQCKFALRGDGKRGGQAATDRDVSSRRIGVDWKQGKEMRAETARAPELRQWAPIDGVPRSWFMGSRRFLSKLHTDHEPGPVGRARSPSAPMRECGARRNDRPTDERQRFMGSPRAGAGLMGTGKIAPGSG